MTSASPSSSDPPAPDPGRPPLIDSSDPVVVFVGLARWSVPRFSDACWFELRSGTSTFRTRYPRPPRHGAMRRARPDGTAPHLTVRTPIRIGATALRAACEGEFVHDWTVPRRPGDAEREIAAELVASATHSIVARSRRDAVEHVDVAGVQLRTSARTVAEIDAVIAKLMRTRVPDVHGLVLLLEHRREHDRRQTELLAYLDRSAATADDPEMVGDAG